MSKGKVPKNDEHPRTMTMYRHSLQRREDQEEKEVTLSDGATPIIQGDWKLNVHNYNTGIGYRRYHRHGKRWYCVVSDGKGTDGIASRTTSWRSWKCGHCSKPVPEEMEGFINLARWAVDETP